MYVYIKNSLVLTHFVRFRVSSGLSFEQNCRFNFCHSPAKLRSGFRTHLALGAILTGGGGGEAADNSWSDTPVFFLAGCRFYFITSCLLLIIDCLLLRLSTNVPLVSHAQQSSPHPRRSWCRSSRFSTSACFPWPDQ